MAATNSAFRTETRDEHLYNHIELFNRSSSPIDAPAANRCQDCRERQPTENQIATGRRMFGDYRTEPSNEHLYYNIQSINKPSSVATESQEANQTSQDDRRGQQPTGNSKTMGRRVTSAVFALAFLAMLASLLALKWELVKSCRTNGDLDDIQQQLTNVERNISLLADQNFVNKMIAKIIDQVSSNQTEGRRLLETEIENQTLELNQINCAGCQDCRILKEVNEQLNEVLENLNDTVSKIRDKVSSIQTIECSGLLAKEINHLTSRFEDLAARVNQSDEDPWIKMNESPICFGAGNNQFGSFSVPSNGTLASVKLVHLDGYVRCNRGNWTRSFWGCGQNPELDVNVEIKDGNTAILPSREFLVKEREEKESLRIPGYNSLSPELVLSADLSNPPKVIQGQRLRLSHREDSSSPRNGEKSCCDVYARFT